MEKILPAMEKAAGSGVQILCLEELSTGPYFAAEQDPRWYRLAEPFPDGPTLQMLREETKRLGMVLLAPLYERAPGDVLYNSTAVIDADGRFLGRYRKMHIPQVQAGPDPRYGFWEKFYFRPGDLGYPVFRTAFGTIGVYTCYDRHFPEGARILGLKGAEIVFNPSATTAGHAEYLWHLEQPAHAVANGYFVAAINRVGTETPWSIGHFFGNSYLVNPRGEFLAQAGRTEDELLVADADLSEIERVRDHWQFFRDRRTDSYEPILGPS